MQTLLTSFGASNVFTSALVTPGRGYVHAQFRVGSAISAPLLSTMSLVMFLQAKIPDSDDLWCDVQTWSVAVTEAMAGRDYSYATSEPTEFRLGCKTYQSGRCQGRIWVG